MPINKDLKPGDYIIAGAHPVDAVVYSDGIYLTKQQGRSRDQPPQPPSFDEVKQRIAAAQAKVIELRASLKKR